MVNRHLDKVRGKTTSEDLLLPSSICIRYDQVTQPPKESDISTILVDLEPLELKLGYRELDNFKGVNEVILELLDKLNEHTMDSENMNYETLEDKQQELEVMNEREKRRALGESPKMKAFRERRVKELILQNIQLQMKSFVILLLDDTKDIEHPIISFNIHDVKVKCSLESGQDTPAVYILKKMAIYQYPILKVDAELSLGANYFNHSNGAYEPLIEPWEIFATVKQKDLGSSQIIDVKSSKMLNLNLTYGVAICLKNVLDALDQNSEDWVDEVQLEELKRKATMRKHSSNSNSIRYTSMSGTEDAKDGYITPRKVEKRSASRDSSRRHASEERKAISSSSVDENQGVSNFETDSFEFQNNIGVPIRVELENFSVNINKFKGSLLKEQEQLYTEGSTFELGVRGGDLGSLSESMYTQGEAEGIGKGKRSQLKNTAKFFKKQMNKLSNFKIIDDPPLKIDIGIEGMELIGGVPIEVTGRKSYELYFEGEDYKTALKRKFQLSIISDVYQEGINKIVSLESQLIMTNQSDIGLQIAYAFLTEEIIG